MTSLVVRKGIKAYAKEKQVSISKEAEVNLEQAVKDAIDKASVRCLANKRSVIKSKDF